MPTVLITGGHKGIGLQASRRIAMLGGHDLLLGGRDLPELERVAAGLRNEFGTNARALAMDVSSLASVREAAVAAKQLVAQGNLSPLSALLLNAGAQFQGPPRYSADGYELTFATNCLGHFLLLNLLLDEISAGGRVVFTASGTHDPATMDGKIVGAAIEPDAFALANQGKSGIPINGGRRYSTSKLCMILYAYELNRRLRAAGTEIVSTAYDPGMIPETGLITSVPRVVQALLRTGAMKQILKAMGVTIGSLSFSGEMLGNIAVNSSFANASGKFLQSRNGQSIEARSSPVSYDRIRASELWNASMALVHLSAGERSRLIG